MDDTRSIPDSPSKDELAVLRSLVEGTACNTGQEFFQSFVRHLAAAVEARYAFVAEFAGGTRARTLPFWFRDRITENVEWDVIGTPCEEVVGGNLCHHPSGVKDNFPGDKPLVEWGIESYLGVPLCDAQGKHLGHPAVFDERPKLFLMCRGSAVDKSPAAPATSVIGSAIGTQVASRVSKGVQDKTANRSGVHVRAAVKSRRQFEPTRQSNLLWSGSSRRNDTGLGASGRRRRSTCPFDQ